MSKKGRELRQNVEDWLKEFGVARPYDFGKTGSCHQEVRFVHHGHRIRFVFPGSPGDRRTALNTRSTLRRVVTSAAGSPVPGAPEVRPVLDVGGLLPRQPHDVGGRGSLLVENKIQAWLTTEARSGRLFGSPLAEEDA